MAHAPRAAKRPQLGYVPLCFLALLAGLIAGCHNAPSTRTDVEPGPIAPPTAARPLRPGKEQALSALVDRVRTAFRREGDALVGGDDTLDVRTSGAGVEITPAPGQSPAEARLHLETVRADRLGRAASGRIWRRG